MTSGIYLITNKINDHMYVGGSIDIERRFREHKNYKGLKTQAVDRAIKKYGADNFTYQIITELPADWKVIGEHEKYWVKFYNTFKDKQHYNLDEGGRGRSDYTHSNETKMKISKAKKGKPNPTKGISRPDMAGENNPFYGKHHTEETKIKMSENHADYSGDNHPGWKNYARIVKCGFKSNGKQIYAISFNGKRKLKQSISIDKLKQWFNSNYPDEELVIDEGIKLE